LFVSFQEMIAMKWFRVLLGVLFLTSMLVVPSGCGGKTEELDASKYVEEHEPGHEEAEADMEKMEMESGGEIE
jgi:hypothetical protein